MTEKHKGAKAYSPEYVTPLHAVAEARAAYAVWHAALGLLAGVMAASTEYDVTGPAAPASPWVEDRRGPNSDGPSGLLDEVDTHIAAGAGSKN